MDTWKAIDDERSALADDLATLADDQWDVLSLCTKWRIRDVVGHLIFGTNMKFGPILLGMLKSGMNFNRFMARVGMKIGVEPPAELLVRFQKTIGLHSTLNGAPPEIMLVDLVCHSQDIRRPTGMTRIVPEATLLTVADTIKSVGFPLHTKRRIAGLRMSATDADWSAGDGPSVEGPLASLVLAMAGRPSPLEDLSGDGMPTIRARM
jgi:uncharacterized protein (TIGR03083 family)